MRGCRIANTHPTVVKISLVFRNRRLLLLLLHINVILMQSYVLLYVILISLVFHNYMCCLKFKLCDSLLRFEHLGYISNFDSQCDINAIIITFLVPQNAIFCPSIIYWSSYMFMFAFFVFLSDLFVLP